MKLFPKLRLVEYPWRETVNEFKIIEGSVKINRMVFKGEDYDIYIEGVTRPIEGEGEYEKVIAELEADLEAGRRELERVESGQKKVSKGVKNYMRKRVAGLEALWRRHQQGEKLSAKLADYIVGGLVSEIKEDAFAKPRTFAKVPVFHSHSYVIGRSMIGLTTSGAGLKSVEKFLEEGR